MRSDVAAVTSAAAAAIGVALVVIPGPVRRRRWRQRLAALNRRATTLLRQGGLDHLTPAQFAGAVGSTAVVAGTLTTLVLGPGLPAVGVAVAAGSIPVGAWRARRRAARATARDHWPQLIEELRILTGPAGRPIPQALIEAGLRGPAELQPAFRAAQREWALSTDFARTVEVLKDRVADPTADATCETLLVIHDVGGDLDRRLQALAQDRRQDLRDRKEAEARQAGARLARLFVLIVPAGMAVAGLNVGTGAAAYRSTPAQLAVLLGVALVGVCWWWAGRVMRLPDEERVFDR